MKNFILKMLLVLGLVVSFASFANADDNFIKEGNSYTVTSKDFPKYLLYFTVNKSLISDLFIIIGKWTNTKGKTKSFVAALKNSDGVVYIGNFIYENGTKDSGYHIKFITQGDDTMAMNGYNTLTLKKVSMPEDMR